MDTNKMSAEQRVDALKMVGHHYAKALDLIARGDKTLEEVGELVAALDQFNCAPVAHANEGTVAGPSEHKPLSGYDTPFTKLDLSPNDRKWIAERGIRYLGELYCMDFEKGRYEKNIKTRRRMLQAAHQQLGLPQEPEADPVGHGWRPWYWKDQVFMNGLSVPVMTELAHMKIARGYGKQTEDYHRQGTHFMGQLLRLPKTLRWLRTIAKGLRNGDSHLWAGALVPPEWSAPKELPREVEDLLKTVRLGLIGGQRPQEQSAQNELALIFRGVDTSGEKMQEMLQILGGRVEHMALGQMINGKLLALDITYVFTLVTQNEGHIRRSTSRRTVERIKELLAELGLRLGMRLPEDIVTLAK